MKRIIKTGENMGIAKQVQGAVVKAHIHPRYKNLYQFQYGGEWWGCSEYAFKPLEKNSNKAACIIIQAVFVCTKMHKFSENIMTIKQKRIKIKKERGMSIQWQHKSLIHYRLRKP